MDLLLLMTLLSFVQAATVFSDGSKVYGYPIAWDCGWANYIAYNVTTAPSPAPGSLNDRAVSVRLNSSGAYQICTRPCSETTSINMSNPNVQYTAISAWINGGSKGNQALQTWVTGSDFILFNAVANTWIQLVVDFNSLQAYTVESWIVQMVQGWNGPQPQPELFFDNIVLETHAYRCDNQALAYSGGSSAQLPGRFVSFNISFASPPSRAPGSVQGQVLKHGQGNLKLFYDVPFPTASAGFFITGLRFWVHGGSLGGRLTSRFLNSTSGPVGWTQQSTVLNQTWREVRLVFNQLNLPAQIHGIQISITSASYMFFDEFFWTSSQIQPVCVSGLVYVPNYVCSSFLTSGVPASLLAAGLGRCPSSYNDSHWCRGWEPNWSSNVVVNSQAQLQLTSFWTVSTGSFVNNGPGQGFSTAGTQNSPAKRIQRIDLIAQGFDTSFLAKGPAVRVMVNLKPTPTNTTGAQDWYRYQISLLDGLNQSLAVKSGSLAVVGVTMVDFVMPSVGIGGLRFIVFEDQGFDDQNSGGPTIENVGVFLNLDECAENNGGCDPHRACVDQLQPPAQCGSCLPGYLDGPAGACIFINPCDVGNNQCPDKSTCNLDADLNATCICLPGYFNSSENTCEDILECKVGNSSNGGCGPSARCREVKGAASSTPVCLPFPAICSLFLDGIAPSCTPFNISDNLGGQILSLSFVGSPVVTNVRFGPSKNADRFTCANFSAVNSMVTCTLPSGVVGLSNFFTITLCTPSSNCAPSNICCYDVTTRESGTFNLPLPTVTANSLRFFPAGQGTTSLQSNTSFGDLVAFSGTNFLNGSNSLLFSEYSISMRSLNNSQVLTCVRQPALSTVTTTVCQTPPGFGLEYFFGIVLDSKTIVNSSDTYSYPISPVVVVVRGCPFNVSSGTGGCPTSGGTPITITGGYFGPTAVVSVGGLNCATQEIVGSTSIVCLLPPLTGVATITVAVGALYSLPSPLITYAVPTIDSVWGCSRSLDNLTALDCARNGTSILTLQGSNFGLGPPLILIGQTTCTNVIIIEPDSVVACSIPAGMNTDVGVLFVQAGGFQAAPPYPSLSYYQCSAGFASANITCSICLAGTFTQSAGQLECTQCSGGFVSNTSASRCSACEPGTYAEAGWGLCRECTLGRYSPAFGQSVCTLCAPGLFSNLTGQSTCSSCSLGTAQFQAGQSYCNVCTIGTYANFFGYTSCASCPFGKFADNESTVDCLNCPPGTSQPQTAATSCVPCVAGRHAPSQASKDCTICEAGTFSLPSSTSCTLCEIGFFQSSSGHSSCSSCPDGTEASASGRSACDSCVIGRFATESENGTAACRFCAGGSYQPNIGQSMCLFCTPGRVNNQEFSSCEQCETGRYTPSTGSSVCHVCTSGSVPDALSIGCLCPIGTFARTTTDGLVACDICPLGAVCDRPGISFEALETKEGFWRPSIDSVTYYRCKAPSLCVGGHNSSCDGYRTGPVCGVCLEGYAAGGPEKSCGKCPEQNLAWSYTVLIFLALLFVMVVCLYLVLRFLNLQQRKLILYTRAIDEANTEKMKSTLDAFGPNEEYFAQMRKSGKIVDLHEVEQESSVANSETCEGALEPPKASVKSLLVFFDSMAAGRALALTQPTSQRAPNFIYKCKILLGFFQVASIMPLNGVVSWPKYWSQFISVFSFFNFDFVPWETLGCATSISYLQKAVIVGCIPVAAVLVIAVVVYFSMLCSREAGIEVQMAKQQAHERAWTQFVKLVLFTVFLLYPFTSKMTLGVYNCVHVEGVSYLAADFAVECTGSEYWIYAGSNFVFVILYPIGIPVVYFFLIRSIRHRLRDPHVILLYGFLYDAYQPECWYWEILDMLHKLLLTSALLFLPVNFILGACMLTVVAYLMGLLLLHPYIRKGDDRFHLLVQCNLYFLALVGLILSTVPDPYASTNWSAESLQTLLSLLLIAINVALFVGFFMIAGRNLWKIYKNSRGEKQIVLTPKQGDSEEYEQHPQQHESPRMASRVINQNNFRSFTSVVYTPPPPPLAMPGPPPAVPDSPATSLPTVGPVISPIVAV